MPVAFTSLASVTSNKPPLVHLSIVLAQNAYKTSAEKSLSHHPKISSPTLDPDRQLHGLENAGSLVQQELPRIARNGAAAPIPPEPGPG